MLGLPKPIIQSLTPLIDSLSGNPYPSGCKKLSGLDHTYRIRHGDYRIVYSVFDTRLIVQIIKIGHRKDIYR
ncbi:MAG: type II toxin-antitoxin system RelE/ParE family toxin [Methylovulum sp.]|uniref:type II toxin-antitoxin system RelE family toxin n=1 Tax=Methylovulum sp. TaxID=1916980 RepID=UPI0026177A7B|nr:type II toxin-antitoxin system RelE/ParE family toxin [Methylovulum sp.]MDD2725074.1 type II toxin-antitoxin system RelE/ParE family toxin [Methylovulum sp.]